MRQRFFTAVYHDYQQTAIDIAEGCGFQLIQHWRADDALRAWADKARKMADVIIRAMLPPGG